MILAILIIIVLFAGIITLAYGSYNLTVQNEKLEETILFYQDKIDQIREKALLTEIELKEIDIRGSFEADDEVGFVFKTIKEITTELTQTIQSAYEPGE